MGLLGYLSGLNQPSCSVYLLRMVNLLFSVLTLVVIYSILKVLNAGQVSPETGPAVCLSVRVGSGELEDVGRGV